EARANLERARKLFDDGVSSKAELDRAEAARQSLEADADRARRAVDEARAALTYATITAPISGRVVDRLAEPGDTATPGVPLLRLYDAASLRLEANVRESLAARLKPGTELRARIDATGEEFAVRVDEVVPQTDAGSRTMVVKASFDARANLDPGMFGRLLLPAGEASRLYVPSSAVQRTGQLEFVQVPEGDGMVRRFVRTAGREGAERVEVLSGLKEGESVLVR
ncbi:efflux RND transporter periplasmic adaptor subunit, partial [Candidatus Poribacteria bacterium]|nr:efflux RND transporter periplasmic adaptor subunit [Candidatus Poribacteria bacterium]